MQPFTVLFSLALLFTTALCGIVSPAPGFSTSPGSSFKFSFEGSIILAIYSSGGLQIGLQPTPVSTSTRIIKLEAPASASVSNITLPSSIGVGKYNLVVLESIVSLNVNQGIPSYWNVYNQTFNVVA